MERMTQSALVMMASLAAFTVQAGRGIDNPVPAHKVMASEHVAAGAGVTYTGRPNDTTAYTPTRGGETAEFAVMDVQEGSSDRDIGGYHGRAMDNPAR